MRPHLTHEYQGCIEVVVVLLEEITVVFVCLSIKHIVEMSPRVHLRRSARVRESFQRLLQSSQNGIEPRSIVVVSPKPALNNKGAHLLSSDIFCFKIELKLWIVCVWKGSRTENGAAAP